VAPNRASFSRSWTQDVNSIVKNIFKTHLANENRATKEWLLRQLTNSPLSILLRSKLDNPGQGIQFNTKKTLKKKTYPHPLDTPVGVTRTSAKSTSPAAKPKSPINTLPTQLIPSKRKMFRKEKACTLSSPTQG